jgi:hypothetical protein
MAPSAQQQDPGAAMRNVMSSPRANTSTIYETSFVEVVEQSMNVTRRRVQNVRHHNSSFGSVIDGGAKGGLASAVMERFETTGATCNGIGLADMEVTDLVLSVPDERSLKPAMDQLLVYFLSIRFTSVFVLPQYSFYDRAKSIHAPAQLRAGGQLVDDCPRESGGQQILFTACGKIIPLAIRGGLPHMDMRLPLPDECDGRYPTVWFTLDQPWTPTVIDNEWTLDELAALPLRDEEHGFIDPRIDDFGNLICTARLANVEACITTVHEEVEMRTVSRSECHRLRRQVNRRLIDMQAPDFRELGQILGGVSAIRAQKTLENSTQNYQSCKESGIRHQVKSRCPGANVPRINNTICMV